MGEKGYASIDYTVHSHPYYFFSTAKGDRVGGSTQPSGDPGGKTGDMSHAKDLESKYGTKYGIILGTDKNGGNNMISFYNSSGTIATMPFEGFKKTVEKIR